MAIKIQDQHQDQEWKPRGDRTSAQRKKSQDPTELLEREELSQQKACSPAKTIFQEMLQRETKGDGQESNHLLPTPTMDFSILKNSLQIYNNDVHSLIKTGKSGYVVYNVG